MSKRTSGTPEPVAPTGYLPAARARYRWVAMPGDDGPEGEPFRAEMRANLTFGEIDAIDVYGKLTFEELWRVMAPHVRAWNLLARDMGSGEIVAVPPPAEAGPDALRAIDHASALWLASELRTAHLGGEERGKGSPAPDPSPAPESGDGSA